MVTLLDYKGFRASANVSEADGLLYGVIQDIDDFVTFEGNTVPELCTAFHDAVDDYLGICKEIGKSPYRCGNSGVSVNGYFINAFSLPRGFSCC